MRYLLLILVTAAACSEGQFEKMSVKEAKKSFSNPSKASSNSNSNPNPEPGALSDPVEQPDENAPTSVDEPIMVGGSFLYCAPDWQSEKIKDLTYGCRLQAGGEKVALPPLAEPKLTFFHQNVVVNAIVHVAPASSPWQWTIQIVGPFSADVEVELQLSNVEVSLSPVTNAADTLVILPGLKKFTFERAILRGGRLELVAGGARMEIKDDSDPANKNQSSGGFPTMLPPVAYVTAGNAGSGELTLSFNNETCTYRGRGDSYYFFDKCAAGAQAGDRIVPDEFILNVKSGLGGANDTSAQFVFWEVK